MARNLKALSEEAIAALDAGDPEALIALNHAIFGDSRMDGSDSTPDEGGDDETDEPDEGDEPDEDEGNEDSDGEEDDSEEDEDSKPLGDKGRKALDRMKAERKELRKTIRELKTQIAELRKGDDGEKDELETAREETQAERTKRIKAEKRLAAKQAGLPESWADRLQGDDFEDFLDDAEALAEDMPKTPNDRKGGGGAKDGHKKRKKPSLDDQIAEAEKSGDMALARRLKAQKVHSLRV